MSKQSLNGEENFVKEVPKYLQFQSKHMPPAEGGPKKQEQGQQSLSEIVKEISTREKEKESNQLVDRADLVQEKCEDSNPIDFDYFEERLGDILEIGSVDCSDDSDSEDDEELELSEEDNLAAVLDAENLGTSVQQIEAIADKVNSEIDLKVSLVGELATDLLGLELTSSALSFVDALVRKNLKELLQDYFCARQKWYAEDSWKTKTQATINKLQSLLKHFLLGLLDRIGNDEQENDQLDAVEEGPVPRLNTLVKCSKLQFEIINHRNPSKLRSRLHELCLQAWDDQRQITELVFDLSRRMTNGESSCFTLDWADNLDLKRDLPRP